jgi:hypothetical protein
MGQPISGQDTSRVASGVTVNGCQCRMLYLRRDGCQVEKSGQPSFNRFDGINVEELVGFNNITHEQKAGFGDFRKQLGSFL